MKVLKWAWHYGSLYANKYDSVEDAVQAAMWASDAGEESLQSMEVIADDGTTEVYTGEPLADLMRPFEDAARAEEAANRRPAPTVLLDIRGPNGDWSCHGSYWEQEKADLAAAEWTELLGADRVRLRPYGKIARP